MNGRVIEHAQLKRHLGVLQFSLPFISAQAMADPLNSLTKISMKPYHQELTASFTGWKELTRPFVAFVLFLVGKLLSVISFLLTFEILVPGLNEKPFTMYITISAFLIGPLGLQFFLAFQEFVFYTFSTYQAEFVNYLLGMAKRKSNYSNIKSATCPDLTDVVIIPHGLTFHEAISDLREMLASMTQIFGPFLLQNLTLMLLYWLLHLYYLCFMGYSIYVKFRQFSDTILILQLLALAGSALIVR